MPSLDSIEFWKERIRWGRKQQSKLHRTRVWRRNRKWYKNEYGERVISVNLVFAIGRKLVTDLYFKNPIILAKPTHPSSTQNAPIMEAVDRDLVDVMNFKQEIKDIILDAYATNLGILKIGYHSWSTLTPASGGVNRTTRGGAMKQLMTLLSDMFGEPVTGTPNDLEDSKYSLYSYHNSIKPNAPWAIRWPPEDVVFPYGCRSVREVPWIAFKFRRPKYELEADPAYENVSGLKGVFMVAGDEEEGVISPKDREVAQNWPEETIIGWEVWDQQTNRVRVFTMDGEKWLRNEDPELGVEGLPYAALQYNPTGDDVYGVTDVEQIAKQVVELNETRTIEMWHKKMSLTRLGVDINKIKKEDLENLVSGVIQAVVRCTDNPEAVLKYFTPPMSNELFVVDERIRRDIAELMNFSRNQGGAAESPRKSASEAMIIAQAIAQRADERRDQVGDLIEYVFAQKINPVVWKNWTTERWTRVAGRPDWTPYVGADLKGYYGVKLQADSGAPLSGAERKQDARELFGVFRGDPLVNQYPLYRHLIEVHEGLPVNEMLPDEQTFMMIQQAMMKPKGGESESAPANSGGKTSEEQSSGTRER